MSAEVVSRLNPAAWRRQDLRHAAHLWNLNLLRAVGLTPTQRNLAFIIGQDTLARGFNFCIYDSLESLLCERVGESPVLALSKGNVTEALCGFTTSDERRASERRAAGLEGFGIIRLEWVRFEGRQRWIVTPVADARHWRCEMLTVERLAQRRQLDQDVRRFAPHLPGDGLAPDSDLHDALPLVQTGERPSA